MVLECKLGNLKVDKETLEFTGEDSYQAFHKFVTQSCENSIIIHVAPVTRHIDVVNKFRLTGIIVGGGSLYANISGQLVIGDFSGNYGAIPKEIAGKFGNLILPALQKQYGLTFSGLIVNPLAEQLSGFWKDLGYRI